MIDVSECVNDPDLGQPFSILRSAGSFLNGVWQSNVSTVSAFGVISPATDLEIKMVPEGDIAGEMRVFWTSTPIFTTNANGLGDSTGGSSDILVWRGDNYRVLGVKNYQDYGYYRAIATRMKAD